MMLAACGLTEDADTVGDEGEIGYVRGFFGGVAADEPRAVLIGRDVLSAGGSAADAAVAMYFALAVTMPSSASLGGGGVCLVHDPGEETTEVLEFFATRPAAIPSSATRPSAVPGNPRGFFALHAKHGRLRWESLLSPASNLARFGSPVSRALAADLKRVEGALAADPEMVRVFGSSAGPGMIGESEMLEQIDLATVIATIQTRGPGDFYTGSVARMMVDAANAAGGSLSLDDLRSFRPVWRDTVQVDLGYHEMHVAQPPATAGMTAAVMMYHLAQSERFEDAGSAARAHLLAEAAARAYGDRGRWMQSDGSSSLDAVALGDEDRFADDMADFDNRRRYTSPALAARLIAQPENAAATSFVAVDRFGGAVSCGLTMNNIFGTGRVAPGTGVVLATIPGNAGRGPWSLSPLMVINANTQDLFWVSGATGGVAASTATVNVMARAMLAGQSLHDALEARRIHHGGVPDITYVESGITKDEADALQSRGHTLQQAREIGRVNAFYCPDGVSRAPQLCEVSKDPRGLGMSLVSD